MPLSHFLQIILDEIATEGLEGVTLQCLWEYLKAYNYFESVDIDDHYKEYLWKFIRNFESIDFYQLKEPRECNFKFQDRLDYYKYDKDCYTDETYPFIQSYTYKKVADINVYGSCHAYESRILVNNDIKCSANISYKNVMTTYGNSLVLVAKQEYRIKFLGIENLYENLSKEMYCFLELIVRSRHYGIKSAGKNSASEFIKNPRTIFYLKKKLKFFNLIQIQKINIIGGTKPVPIIHFHRFYRPYYNIFEQNMEKLLLYMTTIYSRALLKSAVIDVLNLSEEFLNRAKQLGWVESFMADYRRLIFICDIDNFYTDKQLLSFYINDFRLSPKETHPLSLIDKRSWYIRPIKTMVDLQEHLDQMSTIFENDDDPVPDVIFTNKHLGINLEEPLNIQVLKLLAQQPLNRKEIQKAISLKSGTVRGIIEDLEKCGLVTIGYEEIGKHSIPYYKINQTLEPVTPVNDVSLKRPMEESAEEELPIIKFIHPSNLTKAIRNPKRQERYNFIKELVSNQLVIPGLHVAQKLIREWETGKKLKEIMDKKSFKRIIDDLQKDRHVKVIEVEFTIKEKPIKEIWMMSCNVSRDSDVFKEKYSQRLLELTNINKSDRIVVKKIKKPKFSFINSLNHTSQLDVIKLIKGVTWVEKTVDFKFPELPLMLRRKLFHEFIWYVSIGYHLEANNYFDIELDQDGHRIYMDTFNWKRFVAPLQQDSDEKFITFNLNDLLVRMPLCMLCLLIMPKTCTQELYDCLIHDELRWATMEIMSTAKLSVVSFLLTSIKRRGILKMVGLLESLVDMGIITKRDHNPPIRYKEDCLFFLNREIFLTDTSKFRLPVSDELIWKRLPRYQWLLNSKLDVINYWENSYNICTNTQCDSSTYRSTGVSLLSPESYETFRNSDFISNNVLENGPVPQDIVENIKQFGAWLPIDSFRWKDLGPGGYYRSISSWCILTWCPNRYDKVCSQLPETLRKMFSQFRTSLILEDTSNPSAHLHVSSLNESLSLILNEINIVLTAVSLLNYEKKLEKFWNKIRLKKWFKSLFSHIRNQKFHSLKKYISLLSSDHEKERSDLIREMMRFPFVKSIANIKDFSEHNSTKEATMIRLLLTKLIKLHRFIPQLDTLSTKQYILDKVSNDIVITKEEKCTQLVDVITDNADSEIKRKIIKPDFINTVAEIVMLQLMKYMTGCMHSYKEFSTPDFDIRNQIFTQYSHDMLLSVINNFKHFYTLEPLKANKANTTLISSGSLDNRLIKLSYRLLNRAQTESHQEAFIRRYLDWSSPPLMENVDGFSDKEYHVLYNTSRCEAKDVMSLIGMTYGMQPEKDSIQFEISANNFRFDEAKYKSKSVCQSSVYNIDMKKKNLATVNWNKIAKDSYFTLNISEDTHHSLFTVNSHPDIWKELSEFIYLKSDQSASKRCRTRSQSECIETVTEKIMQFITEGQHAGQSYFDLKFKFHNFSDLSKELKKLMRDKRIYLVGFNTFNFVSSDYIRSWLIKVPQKISSENGPNKNHKRKSSAVSTEKKYFLPEFYRGESGDFKCVTFLEIINRIFVSAYKSSGTTLNQVINDFSVFLGEVVVRKLVEILATYEVLELSNVMKSGNAGLFKKRATYEHIDYEPFGDSQLTTVIVRPNSHLKMSHLISDLGSYFNIDLISYMKKDKKNELSVV